MELGLIGLGRMGGNMAERVRRAGHEVVGYDRDPKHRRRQPRGAGAGAEAPRVVWVMVPAGEPTRATVRELGELLEPGDVVVDGGNSKFTDDQMHAEQLAAKGIGFVDAGVSGGVWGLQNGYALMVGGSQDDVAKVQPIFDALKPEGADGFVHAGAVGAGHFAKMVHNGIEYGMMQAYGEGYELLAASDLIEDVPGTFHSWSRARSSAPGCWTCRSGRCRRTRTWTSSPATPTTPARAGGRSRPAIEQRRPDAGDHRVAVRPLRLPAGRLADDEGGRGAAQPVRRARCAAQ